MKSEIVIKVFIMEHPRYGEVWEVLKVDGTTRTFKPGTAEYLKDKTFKTGDAALEYGIKKNYRRFQVVRQDPPVGLSRTWEETVLHDVKADKN